MKFGDWVFLNETDDAKKWLCECLLCGVRKAVFISNLKRGLSKGCGCRNFKHGECSKKETRERMVWRTMKNRCHNPRSSDFPRYGARGVVVCERWRNSYLDFLSDMGRCPSSQHTIDRIDGSKGYSPENCRWADKITQGNNRSNNRRLTVNGETLSISQWARRVGKRDSTIRERLRRGWDAERAVFGELQS